MTKKLVNLLYLSVLLLICHSLEEYLTDFYGWAPWLLEGFGVVSDKPMLTFLVMMWGIFGVLAVMATSNRCRIYMAVLPGLLFTFELHHWIEFIASPHYKGGDATATLIPVFLYFYGREWWRNLGSS